MTGFDPKYNNNKTWVTEDSDLSLCLSELDRDKKQRLKFDQGENESPDQNNLEDTQPNFIPAVFSMLSKDEEFIASDEQVKEVQAVIDDFYSATPEVELDFANRILQISQKSKETRKRANTQSLTTVQACSEAINSVLIS